MCDIIEDITHPFGVLKLFYALIHKLLDNGQLEVFLCQSKDSHQNEQNHFAQVNDLTQHAEYAFYSTKVQIEA